VERVTEALAPIGADRDSELFFICRSGQRSLKAAQAMATAGFTRCRNVSDGFEGPLDPNRHRGQLGGWKAKGLPWAQG
jgi:rhodanese-related sulfurtransferase